MGERCFYCLDEKVSISICLNCRSRLEKAENEMKELRKQTELRRQYFWKKMNEYKRNIKRNS